MNTGQEPSPLPSKVPELAPARIALGTVLFAALYLANSWERDFWTPEEPDFAAAIKEMEARSEGGEPLAWLKPTIGGQGYFEKPPLLYWCALLVSRLTGFDPRLAYRFPVAAAAALSVAATYLAGRRLFDARISAAAALIQASTYLHFHCGSRLLTDALFSAASGLAVLSLVNALQGEPGSRRWALTGWTSLALAALSKSALLAPALVLGPLALFILFGGPLGLQLRLRRLRPLEGSCVFLALVAPVYLALVWANGWEFAREHLLDQHLLRLWRAESHARPLFHYLLTLPVDFLPWSPFLPLAVFHGKANFGRPSVRVLMIWVVWTFILLSAISSKQGKYLLPMWPALSLLVASGLLSEERESIWEGFLGQGIFRGMAWALWAPLAGVVACAVFWFSGLQERFDLSETREVLGSGGTALKWTVLGFLAGGALLLAGVSITRRLKKGDPNRAILYLAGATLFAYLAFSFTYHDLNRIKSARSLGKEVRSAVGGEKLALYGRNRAAVHYYLDRPLSHIPHLDPLRTGSEAERQLDEFLGSAQQVFLLIADDDLRKLKEHFPKYRRLLHPVRERLRFGYHRRATLASNRPP